jgi:thiamine kinase-like enzyme
MPEFAQSDADELRARDLLAARADTKDLADAVLTPLSGGHSNRTWRLDDGDRTFFLRLNAPDAEGLGVDRASECRLLQIVGTAGIAPEVIRCDPGAGLLLTRFVEAEPWTGAQAAGDANLRRIGALLRRLHDLAPDPAIREVSFARQAWSLEAQLEPGTVPDPLSRAATQRFRRLERRTAVTLCHNDPHHLNVLDDGGRIWLVDWEYGGRGDPVYDLAACLAQLEGTRQQRSALLDGYGTPVPCTDAELDDACWVFDYVQWLWYRVRLATDPDPGGAFAARARGLAASLAGRLRAP